MVRGLEGMHWNGIEFRGGEECNGGFRSNAEIIEGYKGSSSRWI